MSTTPQKHLLKVFSGPHVGAEVLLGEGAHVLGSDEDCDVILNDRLIAARHVRITVRGEEVEFTSIGDARVFIDGDEVANARLEPFQYFTIGNTHLAIGPANAEWPNHDFPGYQLVTRDPNETSGSPDAGDQTGVPGVAATTETEKAAAPVSPESGNATSIAVGDFSHDSRWRWIVLGSVIFVVLGTGVTVLVFAGRSDDGTGPSQALALADLESAIAGASDAESSALTVAQKDGYFLVEGFVADFGARQRIENSVFDLLDAYPDDVVELRVLDTEGLASSARNVLNMYTRGRPSLAALEVTAAAPGQVAVSGVIARLDEWMPVRDAILRDVRAINDLDDSQVRLPGQETPDRTPGQVQGPAQELAGDVTAPDAVDDGRWSETGSESETAATPLATHTDDDVPQLSVVRVVGGRRRLLTMADGSIVFEGGRIAGGYVVESIQPDQIVLSRNGIQHSVPLGATP